MISYSRYLSAAANKAELLNEGNLKKCFKMIDTDASGSISKAEMQAAFHMNIPEDDLQWDKLLKGVDLNAQGEIDYRVF